MTGGWVREIRLPFLQISRDELTSSEEKSITGYVGVESDKRTVGLRNVGLRAQFVYITIYVNKRGNKKTLQTIHKPYIELYIALIIRVLRCV